MKQALVPTLRLWAEFSWVLCAHILHIWTLSSSECSLPGDQYGPQALISGQHTTGAQTSQFDENEKVILVVGESLRAA